jgi:hypothetical protein
MPTFLLQGSQKAGTIGHPPVIKSPPLVLATPATIVNINRKAKRYTLWKNGTPFVTIEENLELAGTLPAGTYILRTDIGSVTISLDTAAKPKPQTLWARQKKGPGHWFRGNRIVLPAPAKIKSLTYDGTDAVGIFPAGSHQFVYRWLSPHNIREPGPAVFGTNGLIPKAKSLVGLGLGPGVFEIVPGIGTADFLVYAVITV